MDIKSLIKKAIEYKNKGLDIFAFIHDNNRMIDGLSQTRELAIIFIGA